METIKNYETSDTGASQSLVTLEGFIGDMGNGDFEDDNTVDTSDAVTAINGLIYSLERRDAEIARLTAENERLQGIIENMREIRTTRALGQDT